MEVVVYGRAAGIHESCHDPDAAHLESRCLGQCLPLYPLPEHGLHGHCLFGQHADKAASLAQSSGLGVGRAHLRLHIQYGLERMLIVCVPYFLCGIMDTHVGVLRGMGYSIMPMIVSLTGACALRVVWILTVFQMNRTLFMLFLSYPVTWAVTAAAHFVCYLIVHHKISIGTTPAHLARAVYEGVAYGANHCIVSMKKAGYDVKEIYACGGLAQSDFWMQMHADIIGVPMYTTVESQSAGCLGDCIIAAVGVGIYPNFWEAADSMIRVDKEYIPNMEAHKEYQFYMERYMETWPQMKEIVHKTVDHNNKK